jgi:hypothetical protein
MAVLLDGERLRLYENVGAGVFSDVSSSAIPTEWGLHVDIKSIDVNNDGYLDIIGLGKEQDKLYTNQNGLYLNDQTGKFNYYTLSTVLENNILVDQSKSLVVADFNQDGHQDFVIANAKDQDRLYLNTLGTLPTQNFAGEDLGDYAFVDASAEAFSDRISNNTDLAVGDFNQDGNSDVIVVTKGNSMINNQLYENDNLIENPVYLGDGTGHFASLADFQLPQVEGDMSNAVATFDMDRDGDDDLLVANNRTVKLYENSQAGFTNISFPSIGHGAIKILTGDINNDRTTDVILLSSDGLHTFLNFVASRYIFDEVAENIGLLSGLGVVELGLSDFDHDGDLDLLAVSALDGKISASILTNDGTGKFLDQVDISKTIDLQAGMTLERAVLEDLDRDGEMDILISVSQTTPQKSCRLLSYRHLGAMKFDSAREIFSQSNGNVIKDISPADLDGDNDTDLYLSIANPSSNSDPDIYPTNVLLLNDGDSNMVVGNDRINEPDFDNSNRSSLVDLDHDGDLDILVANFGQNRIYLNK